MTYNYKIKIFKTKFKFLINIIRSLNLEKVQDSYNHSG